MQDDLPRTSSHDGGDPSISALLAKALGVIEAQAGTIADQTRELARTRHDLADQAKQIERLRAKAART